MKKDKVIVRKRRCDVYKTAEELSDRQACYCDNTDCFKCKYMGDYNCGIAYAIDEADFFVKGEDLEEYTGL